MNGIDNTVEKKFNEAKTSLDKVAFFINFLGAWPIGSTVKHKILFNMYIIYHTFHLSMAYGDFVSIFGNLELMTANLMETSIQTISLVRILNVKFSVNLRNLMLNVKDNVSDKNYRDLASKEIYVNYSSIAKSYYKLTLGFGIGTGLSWFTMPLQFCLISWLAGQQVVLVNPYRVRVYFLNVSSTERTILLYIFQSGLPLPPLCYACSMTVNMIITTNICARLAVLSNDVKNIDANSDLSGAVKSIVRRHLELVKLAMTIENVWNSIYCLELLIDTPLIALVMYNTLVALNRDEIVAAVTLISYVGAIFTIMFANCHMGELLNTERERLMDAYYFCDWYNMPLTYRRSLVICMVYTKIPLQITAGKFYIFSYEAFINILKNSLAYVSLLQTLIL